MENSGGDKSPSRWKKDGVDLQALEDRLRIEIDPAFFQPEKEFRPFNQVIEILSVSLDQDKDDGRGPDFEHLAGNPLHKNIQRQLSVCNDVVERITVEHHGRLNSSVQAMGGVARHYNQTRTNVGTLREQLRECKQLLQTGVSQTDVRELWQRKQQYSLVLRLLNALNMIKDAPVKFERLVRQKRFVGAVGLLNESLLNIFSPELVDVPAVSNVRDEMLAQKGRILDMLVEEIADVLFLRAATSRVRNLDKTRGAKNRRRRERGGAGGIFAEDSGSAQNRPAGLGGFTADAASESSAGDGDSVGIMWAGLEVDVTDVGDDEEQALEDPSREFSVYLRLLVEAVRRLRCLDDVERYLLERLSSEVTTLSAMHMRACAGRQEEDNAKARVAPPNGAGKNEGSTRHVQHLTSYLSLVFDSFTCVLVNHMHLVRLLHAARLRDLRDSDPGAPVFEADAPYKESLVVGLWQHIQSHLKDVLDRHLISPSNNDETTPQTTNIEASRVQSAKLHPGLSHAEPSGVSSSDPFLRPLRHPDSSTAGIFSTTLEVDHVNATDYCSSCLLADRSPLIMIGIFRPTLKFVEMQQAAINAMRKEVLESGHVRDRGGRRDVQEGVDLEGSSLSTFMHAAARDRLLPLLSTNCKTTHEQLVLDQDSFFPTTMPSSTQAGTKRGPVDANRGNAPTTSMGARERGAGGAGHIRPSRGAEDIYIQARTLFRAMVQMPQYAEEIGEVLRTSLEEYFLLVQHKFQDITNGSASRSRLERFTDKLRDLLQRDAQHLMYKTHVYGKQRRWDESEVNDFLSTKSSSHRLAKGGSVGQGMESEDSRRRGGRPESSAQEEADDIFESEFMMLKDLWNFDSVPFPVSKQSLLSLRKQQAVACLAFSCDWLAHKLQKICVAIKHQPITAGAVDNKSPSLSGRAKSPNKARDSEGRGSGASAEGTVAPVQKLRQMARKLSQLADDSLICLRLEVYMLVSYYMQQLPSINLGVASGQGSTTAMSLGSVDDQCVVNLNRCIREEQEALSPFEPKGSMALICPRELLAFVLAPLARLLPRLFVRSLRFLKARTITVGGVGKLNKILNTLEQTVSEVTEEDAVATTQEDGAVAVDGTRADSSTVSVAELFGWSRQYVALISMSQNELETFIRNNRTKFSKDEYRVQWSLAAPNRRQSEEGRSQKFEMWWASEKF